MKMSITTVGVTLASVIALSLSAQAQAQTQDRKTGQAATERSQCTERLGTLAQRMREEGYWLTGYTGGAAGGVGYGVGGADPANPQGGAVGTAPRAPAPGMTAEPDAPGASDAPGVRGPSPWLDVRWEARPQYEIRALYRAADVLARNGNEQACMTVADAAEQRYEHYSNQLSELGVEPQEITTWREAEIAAAVPVSETRFPRGIDDMLGADVRSARDRSLGEIEDVVIDPESGSVAYVVVSTGGFLGIGEDRVPVPWEQFRVAPSMSTFVLPVDEAALEQAPRVEPVDLIGEEKTAREDEVKSYWKQAIEQATDTNKATEQ